MHRRDIDMTRGPLLKAIILYTIPIICTGLLQLLFNAADLVVIGQFRGSRSVAAVSATGAITNLIVNLFIGLSAGTGVTVAHALGGNHQEEARRTVHTALPTALIGGVALAVIGVTFAETFLRLMNTPERVLALSAVYMRLYFCGMPFNMTYNFCASILRAAGDTRGPLIYLSIAGVVNVVLNLIFVTLFGMDVEGVALATTISQALSAFLVVRALLMRTDACKLELKKMRFYAKQFAKIIRIGLPAGIQGAMFSISNVIVQSSVNSFGSEIIMSANGAAANLEGFNYTALNAFHQTAVNFIGQNTGAHQYKRVKKIYWICSACVVVLGLAGGTLMYTFGRPLLSMYITDSLQAISFGMMRMTYVTLPYFICGLQDLGTGALRGLGSSFAPMLISVLGVCGIRIGWIYTVFAIPKYHNLPGLYIAYPLSWLATYICLFIVFQIVYRKRVKADLAQHPEESPQNV